MDITEIIKEKLADRSLHQRDLAERTGIRKDSLSLYVNRKREPNLETLLRILEGLHCSLEVRDEETGETYQVAAGD
ncbi:helix-turn-helix transcriptional regulator [Acidaminococcus sp. NSJ-142]|jgi:transcriptional regulator with XRE-family HTH domain|uniref:helix-turn-helix domain-containing protein n=1 Tax=Acidaminococcus TaxID=904 RepID=UPI000CF93C9B|nr:MULTISPECIES: helix-turn-helix transcriptional regulator [Acidaminococcus]MCD2435279.1 helix-turn-helix transcriptional regulator [Acidaminococcus hominis]MCH4096746.1 helix-turn-helix transcriptional regulator [Acidaminococcus provencensis]RHK02663.1 XRE family transcriptional regulator [Acidaminococcus sp. AM05-11]